MESPDDGWVAVAVHEPAQWHFHIIPRNDSVKHEPFPDCWCGPVMDEYDHDIWTHHAVDGREEREMERMKP